uniref:ApeC domain-containing protein n=1 Tax=Caenorhabditis tropicalis TaxID=1561998 RepID=A0A1I7TCD8_9PELO
MNLQWFAGFQYYDGWNGFQKNITLPPFSVGSIESTGQLDQFNYTVLITHDCVSNETENMMCLRKKMYYNGEDRHEYINNMTLTNSGDSGPCSDRWIGGKVGNQNEVNEETILDIYG